MSADERWKQRFDNFRQATGLLEEVAERGLAALSQLEQEGAIQRFEITYELGWKLLKDYLEASGIILSPVTPRTVIRAATEARLLEDGQVWIEMMLHRNLLSHTYDSQVFREVLPVVLERYLPAFRWLCRFLERQGG